MQALMIANSKSITSIEQYATYSINMEESQHMSINGCEIMYTKYLITGASGFLGGTVAEKLVSSGAEVRCLVLRGDTLEKELPEKAVKVYGDTCDINSLGAFFEGAGKNTCVIHCAGIVSVASAPGRKIYDVNVQGTKNIIYMCALLIHRS